MLRMEWSSKYKGKIETLKFKKEPSIGWHRDIDDKLWDIYAIFSMSGMIYISAREVDFHCGYYSTSIFADSSGFHQWIPYKVQIEN